MLLGNYNKRRISYTLPISYCNTFNLTLFLCLFSVWKTHQKNEMRFERKYVRDKIPRVLHNNGSAANGNKTLEFVKKRTWRGAEKSRKPPRALTSFFGAEQLDARRFFLIGAVKARISPLKLLFRLKQCVLSRFV